MIHSTAIVADGAELDSSVDVGPYSVIGDGVQVAAGTQIGAHVVIKGPTKIGADNRIFQFASIGDDPQDKKYAGERTELVIGDRNTIREYCTINRGTAQDKGVTRVGDDNWLMAYSHIAHDCDVGNNTIFANNAQIAGHVSVADWAILGGFTTAHQYCSIGPHAMTSMFTYVTRDIPAYVTASGRPAVPRGINAEGLKRRGFDSTQIKHIREAYRVLYRRGLKLEEALTSLLASLEAQPELEPFVRSVRDSARGIAR